MRFAETNFYRAFSRQRCRSIASSLANLLDENILVLDFGCGNMFVSKELTALRSDISITGIDIIHNINLNGMEKCDEDFHQLGEEHFCRLKENYKVDYVVREKSRETQALDFPITYEDENYRVYQIVCGNFAVR